MDQVIEAVCNKKTKALFVFLDEMNSRFRLINPEGQLVSLAENLFDEEPLLLEGEDIGARLTAEQIDAYIAFLQEHNRKTQLDDEARERTKQRVNVQKVAPAPKPRKTGSRRKKSDPRTGLGATWTAQTLAFYRPQIDSLGPKQRFKVEVKGVGTFELTKQEFQEVFSDVVLSPSYKKEGFFAYREVPEKARRFLKES